VIGFAPRGCPGSKKTAIFRSRGLLAHDLLPCPLEIARRHGAE
jgi:hypothetical protein